MSNRRNSLIARRLTVLIGAAVVVVTSWYGVNSRATAQLSAFGLVEINDMEGLAWVLKWHPEKATESGTVVAPYYSVQEREVKYSLQRHPAIMAALRWGRLDACRLLLKSGAKLDSSFRDSADRGFIFLAAIGGIPEVITKNAQVSQPDSMWIEETPLHVAARQRDIPVLRALIAAGADGNSKDALERVPLDLIYTAQDGIGGKPLRQDLLMTLVNGGANPFLAKRLFQTICQFGEIRTIEQLLDLGADPNAQVRGNREVLDALQARSNSPDPALGADEYLAKVASLLIEKGADIKEQAKEGSTLDSLVNRPRTLQLLVRASGDPNNRDEPDSGYTLLHWAARDRQLEAVRVLLMEGADPNVDLQQDPDYPGTPLWTAIKHNDIPMVRVLLDGGSRLDLETSYGLPIHQAAWCGNLNVTKMLIAAGSKFNVLDPDGESVLDIALKKTKQSRFIAYLRKVGAKTAKEIAAAKSKLEDSKKIEK